MGRGLAAILRSPTPARATTRPSCARSPVELIAPEPAPAAQALRRGRARRRWPSRSRERGVLQPVLVRPLPGGTLRARRRRAPLARGAARRPRDDARRSSSTATTRPSLEVALIENMAREDLNPVEEARAVRRARRGAGPDARGGRPPGRPQPRGGLEPPAPARPARRGARRCSRTARSARATAARCCSPRTTPTAAGWRAPPPTAAGRSASLEAARPRGQRPARGRRAPRPRRRLHPDQEAAAARDRRGARRRARAPTSACARAATATGSSCAFDDADDALALAAPASRRACAPRRAASGRYAPRRVATLPVRAGD